MAWYYDLVVLAILALCVWNGMRKGVSRSLLQTAATILSAVVALWVSQPLAELCYTEFLEKPVVSAVEGQLNTVDVAGLVQTALSDNGIPVSREQVQSMLADPEGTAAQYGFDSGWVNQQIDAAADSVEELTNGVLPSWLMKEIAGDGAVQKETAKSVISGDTHTAAQQLVSTYGKPILCSVLRAILIGVCFVPDTGAADGTFRGFGRWGIGRIGKSGDFALDDGRIDKSCGFCNRGNNALFHRGNDSKNVSIPVALRIEKITGRYFIHRQKLAER